jgi:hypothetical protein
MHLPIVAMFFGVKVMNDDYILLDDHAYETIETSFVKVNLHSNI